MSKGGLTQLDERPKAGRKERATKIRKMVTVMAKQPQLYKIELIGIYGFILIKDF
jgi:hypothetical protein